MTQIHLSDTKRIRFPGRGEEFAQGVEVGMVAVLMDMPLSPFTRQLSAANLDQLRTLAARMGYEVTSRPLEEGWIEATFSLRPQAARPRLQLVHAAEPAARRQPA